MKHRVSHIRRDIAVALVGVLALIVASWIAVGYGLAIMAAIAAFGLMVVVLPVVSIYFDERELPRDHWPGF
jgi:hypothetical protein